MPIRPLNMRQIVVSTWVFKLWIALTAPPNGGALRQALDQLLRCKLRSSLTIPLVWLGSVLACALNLDKPELKVCFCINCVLFFKGKLTAMGFWLVLYGIVLLVGIFCSLFFQFYVVVVLAVIAIILLGLALKQNGPAEAGMISGLLAGFPIAFLAGSVIGLLFVMPWDDLPVRASIDSVGSFFKHYVLR